MADARTTAGALRRPAQAGRAVSATGVELTALPPGARLSLRAPNASLDALSTALGLDLPRRPKRSASAGSRAALWLGPDEWLVLDDDGAELAGACAAAGVSCSAVDISHRNVAFEVAGRAAESTLAAGCPQDLHLSAFPAGACSRTILGKIEIVLWRTRADAFRVECWRSFSDYAFTFLEEAARDAARQIR